MFGDHLAGIYEKAFDADDNWITRLTKAKELSFDFMEISIDETDSRLSRLQWSRSELSEIKRAIEKTDVPLLSMCLSAHRRYPFGSASASTREMAHDIMERAIDLASALGIRVIQLAGYDVYYECSTPESVKLFKEAMLWSAKRAARKEVMLAMEIMDTPFMNSITKHMGYERMINSPWYRVYPDVGNLSAWAENDPAAELSGAIGSIVAVHLKDTIPPANGQNGVFKCVPFGSGCVDFCARFAQLESLGYTGPYMIEMWHDKNTSDIAKVKKAADWLEERYLAAIGDR